MNKTIKLADTEWRIMQELWKEAPLSCRQLEDALKQETGWTRHTIISFLKRMISKGAIRVDNDSPVKLYSPVLKQEEALLEETRSFLARRFQGNSGLLIASFLAENKDITATELEAMIAKLQQAQNEINKDGAK